MIELNKIYNEDCLATLAKMDDNSIDCCVTSPPYYGLRDYGVDGQIGLESTPWLYIEKLAKVFAEVLRVMKPQGTLWLNIGDSYNRTEMDGLKPKDLIGIPWMLAFALRDKGWYLRQDIIWHKPNPMPESVSDRCTKSHEYIFLMTKSPNYYFDHDAMLEKANYDGRKDIMMKGSKKYSDQSIFPNTKPNTMAVEGSPRWTKIKFGGNKYGNNNDPHFQTYSGNDWTPRTKNCMEDGQKPNTMHLNREAGMKDAEYFVRNRRDVWSVCVKPFKEAHFATYPLELIAPCILAGCPEGGVVYDPFCGSGTTCLATLKYGGHRKFIGSELNPQYVEIAERRIMPELIQYKLF